MDSLRQEFEQKFHQYEQQQHRLSDIVNKQQEENRQLWDEINQQQTEINQQRNEINHLQDINQLQQIEIKELRDKSVLQCAEIKQQHVEINKLRTLYETKPDAVGYTSASTVQDPVHACVDESVTLQCTAPHTITVLRGEYGRYADNCTSGCCEPSDADCTELMAETNTEEWQNIKASCDGQTTCDYSYTGNIVDGCALNYTADYLKVFYHCTDFVGFSAYATSDQYPDEGEVVTFPYIYVNAGGGYDTATSKFTCPTTGFYYIYFNVRTWLAEDGPSRSYWSCTIGIRMDGSTPVSVSTCTV